MSKKEKYIKLNKEKVQEIAEIKGVSKVTVYAALKFQTNTPLAMIIRAWALNNGGKLFEEKDNPYDGKEKPIEIQKRNIEDDSKKDDGII